MLEVKNNSINLTRGDCCALKIDIVDVDGKEYIIQDGDTLKFTMRKKVESEEIVLQKILDENILNLEPKDTVNLEFGVYLYDVVLIKATEEIFTVIPTSNFKVLEEVHN